MAGESATSIALRRREKAERLLKQAELYERGAAGEVRTAEVLATLPAASWTVLHDVRWPGRPRANIDHVAIGPSGVFVIDSKNWSGRVTLKDDVLRQNGYSREKSLDAVGDAARAVARLVPHLDRRLVRPVLCFVDRDGLAGDVRGVSITSTLELAALLTAPGPEPLEDYQVRSLAMDLSGRLEEATAAVKPRALAPAPRPRPEPPASRPASHPIDPGPPRSARAARRRSARRSAPPLITRLALTAAMLAGLVGVPTVTHTAVVLFR